MHEVTAIFLHNLGYVLGTGGALFVNVFNLVADRHPHLKQAKSAIVDLLLKHVWVGLGLMLLVHTGELITVYLRGGTLQEFAIHWGKFVAIYFVLGGLGYIYLRLIPRLRKLEKSGNGSSEELRRLQRRLRIIPPLVLVFGWGSDLVLNTIWQPKDAFGFLTAEAGGPPTEKGKP